MPQLTNYDGSIVTTPLLVVTPTSVAELQAIMRQPDKYPGPVRAMGSNHSLTPCVASSGTVINMKGLNKIVSIDVQGLTLTAQAGLEMIEANRAMRALDLQFMLNIEIGNMTVGSASCCHSKDALDGVEFGQVNSYITGMKWVSPTGELKEATEASDPELLSKMRGSYGLAGVVYEATFRIKPLEIIKFDYQLHEVDDLTQDQVMQAIASSQGMVCWTVGKTVVMQTRTTATELRHEFLAETRRFGWNFLAAFTGRLLGGLPDNKLTTAIENAGSSLELGFYRLLSKSGGFTLYDPDKMIDYSKTPASARYAFTFWAFPLANYAQNLKDYLVFAENHYAQHGFRCNMPLGSYFVRKDRHSLLSYTWDGDVLSLDPIHSPGEKDKEQWAFFLRAFNDWAAARNGIPLLNQSPFVKREHCVAAYGDRWRQLSDFVGSADPNGRLLNPFFKDLLTIEKTKSAAG